MMNHNFFSNLPFLAQLLCIFSAAFSVLGRFFVGNALSEMPPKIPLQRTAINEYSRFPVSIKTGKSRK